MQTGFASHPSDDSRPVGTMDTRQRVHGMWAAVATAWGEHADYVDQRVAPVTSRLIEFVSPAAGDHVLELACGAGGLGLEAAARVGAQGGVVLSDVAKQMTDIALERARERGLRNVSGRPLDLEAIDEPDASYDIVLCREGLMFALDPARALREMYRVLKFGGRVALSVWGPRIAESLAGPGVRCRKQRAGTARSADWPSRPVLAWRGRTAGRGIRRLGAVERNLRGDRGRNARTLVRGLLGPNDCARRPPHQDPGGAPGGRPGSAQGGIETIPGTLCRRGRSQHPGCGNSCVWQAVLDDAEP